jgi:hypothetical protein
MLDGAIWQFQDEMESEETRYAVYEPARGAAAMAVVIRSKGPKSAITAPMLHRKGNRPVGSADSAAVSGMRGGGKPN